MCVFVFTRYYPPEEFVFFNKMFHFPAPHAGHFHFTEKLSNDRESSQWKRRCSTPTEQHQNTSGGGKHNYRPTPTNMHRAIRLACHSRRTILFFPLICRLNLLESGSARSKSICICSATNLHTVSGIKQPIMSGSRANRNMLAKCLNVSMCVAL